MKNKNIDRLFQEQLKNLEATPNKRVWNNIESKLTQKKRRILPMWWFSGTVAALFIIGLFIFPFSNTNNSTEINNIETIITASPEIKTETKINKLKTIDSLIKNINKEETILVASKKINKQNVLKKAKTTIEENQITAQKGIDKTIQKEKKIVSSKKAMKKIFLADNSQISKNANSDSLHQNTVEKNVIKPTKDFISVISENKKEIEKERKPAKNKWSVAPTFAVLKSNSFTNTSPADKNLSNSTKGKNSISYGVQIGYKINKKWTIQTGVHLQEMSFINNNIAVAAVTTSSSSAVAFKTGDSYSFRPVSNESFDFATSSLTSTVSFNGSLAQEYGYIEIPIEVKYNLSNNKKFETQLVAGFSSLFLNKNNVNLNTNTFSKSGKANNLNNINFSGNLGFDFNYSFHKNWSINLNPMFKTHINTFSEKSNGFSPFNIGVYSGIKYQF